MQYLFLLVILIISLIDIKTHKIPNYLLTFLLIISLISIFLPLNNLDIKQILTQFLFSIFIIVFFYLLFFIKALGAGDIKLLAIISLYFPINSSTKIVIIAFVFSAIFSLIKLLLYKNLTTRILYFYNYLQEVIEQGKLIKYSNKLYQQKDIISLAPFIFLATLITLWGRI